jgi:hypothetical protein
MSKLTVGFWASVTVISSLILTSPALAETKPYPFVASGSAFQHVPPGIPTTQLNSIKSQINQELIKRINSLQELVDKLSTTSAIPSPIKTDYLNQLHSEIGLLNSLKGKIDSTGDVNSFKIGLQSLEKDHPPLINLQPKIGLVIAVNTLSRTATSMASASARIQPYITLAQSKGNDVTSLQNSLNDMNAKIADAQVQATNAKNALSALSSTTDQNTLKSILNTLKTGRSDLETAKRDSFNVISGLRKLLKSNPSPSPTSNP